MDQVKFTIRCCLILNEQLEIGSIYSHRRSYESHSIRVFDDRNRRKYFTAFYTYICIVELVRYE